MNRYGILFISAAVCLVIAVTLLDDTEARSYPKPPPPVPHHRPKPHYPVKPVYPKPHRPAYPRRHYREADYNDYASEEGSDEYGDDDLDTK